MKRELALVTILLSALQLQSITAQCPNYVQYDTSFIPACDADDLIIDWPNYEDPTSYYKCNGIGKPIQMKCADGNYFCYVFQSCGSCTHYLPPVECSRLPTENKPNCTPLSGSSTTPSPAPGTTSTPKTPAPTVTTPGTLPTPNVPSDSSSSSSTTTTTTTTTTTVSPITTTTTGPAPPTPATTTTTGTGIPPPPEASTTTQNPDIPAPPTAAPTPPTAPAEPPIIGRSSSD